MAATTLTSAGRAQANLDLTRDFNTKDAKSNEEHEEELKLWIVWQFIADAVQIWIGHFLLILRALRVLRVLPRK